jgi:hypothetical protein
MGSVSGTHLNLVVAACVDSTFLYTNLGGWRSRLPMGMNIVGSCGEVISRSVEFSSTGLSFIRLFQMIKNDGSKKQVVHFQEWRPNLGPIKGLPAVLQVDPSCEPILDEIMMTFIYCHKLRKQRRDAARRSG